MRREGTQACGGQKDVLWRGDDDDGVDDVCWNDVAFRLFCAFHGVLMCTRYVLLLLDQSERSGALSCKDVWHFREFESLNRWF